ncbi:MAG: DUF433 domain-containing protein [Verrucomicrobia bacterium]|nr:DUF433 domain-containing protein [Verrucomicrobiota bacterium]
MKNILRSKATTGRIESGDHIVADPRICHGKPTFKGTRIMVWQVLEDVADAKSWDFISQVRWGGRLPVAAIAEAVRLARGAWLDPHGNLVRRPRSHHARELVTA